MNSDTFFPDFYTNNKYKKSRYKKINDFQDFDLFQKYENYKIKKFNTYNFFIYINSILKIIKVLTCYFKIYVTSESPDLHLTCDFYTTLIMKPTFISPIKYRSFFLIPSLRMCHFDQNMPSDPSTSSQPAITKKPKQNWVYIQTFDSSGLALQDQDQSPLEKIHSKLSKNNVISLLEISDEIKRFQILLDNYSFNYSFKEVII
ncbi:hypothetical protein BpHYR1_001468 [Brachionus plicatilis]|uniref:Uncharacterized protein n=1 Tax=Brachionus plicatilis TaxID=10195 RepID=A0A3M7PSK8_BRAPC|nr:hypothetical protein BpHYR1_001468 [Brachionus plicatilis]